MRTTCGTILVAVACFVAMAKAGDVALPLHVNPFVGTITDSPESNSIHGGGKTFPGAATPFGLVQLSPDTVTGGDNGPGYSRRHKTIEGFSFMHMSGIGWYGEFGNFQLMPTTGERNFDREKACSSFRREGERASAGYYSVELDRYGIRTELTAAPRSGILRISYPENALRRIQVDLGRRIGQKERWLHHSRQTVRRVLPTAVEGEIYCPSADGGWGRGSGEVSYTLFYSCEFSEKPVAFGAWERASPIDAANCMCGTNLGFYAEFAPSAVPLLVKAGFSYVSIEGARENLAKDIPAFDFDATRAAAVALWEAVAFSVAVSGGSETERRIFDTALYHAMIDPRAISDHDGRYRDATGGVHSAGRFVNRTVFSGWDVFRSEFPLLTLVRPDVVGDTVNSMMAVMESGARDTLPVWDIFGCKSSCMVGNPAFPVIVDAWEKGIRTFDGEKALELMLRTSEKRANDRRLGYSPGSLSCTLEYAYDDWCVGKMAEMLGKDEIARRFHAYAQSYTNSWCSEVGWMRSRNADGSWVEWKGRTTHGQGCVESNPYQQGWFVPHDVDGLARLMGGRERFVAELESFFERTPGDFMWNDFYNHANEPVHHVPYLFSAAGRPDLAAKWTRRICRGAYHDDEHGLCGNDDVGQMSAWYVLSAIGLHPVCPGDGRWYLTPPIFEEVALRLDPRFCTGRTFRILAAGISHEAEPKCLAKLNGRLLDRSYITTEEVRSGGVLEWIPVSDDLTKAGKR